MKSKLIVFYDGKCNLCFREIRHYKKLDKENLIQTIDISAKDFNAKKFGLNPKQVQVNMHSKDNEGRVYVGVETFAQIWKRVSPYNNLTFILESRVLRPVFNIGYKIFAQQIRPRLPKRKCINNRCEVML